VILLLAFPIQALVLFLAILPLLFEYFNFVKTFNGGVFLGVGGRRDIELEDMASASERAFLDVDG